MLIRWFIMLKSFARSHCFGSAYFFLLLFFTQVQAWVQNMHYFQNGGNISFQFNCCFCPSLMFISHACVFITLLLQNQTGLQSKSSEHNELSGPLIRSVSPCHIASAVPNTLLLFYVVLVTKQNTTFIKRCNSF